MNATHNLFGMLFILIFSYYADKETRCQAFRVCTTASEKAFTSFLCPNGSLFNQRSLTCDWWQNVDCSNIDYSSNNFIVMPTGQKLMEAVIKMLNYAFKDSKPESSRPGLAFLSDNQIQESGINEYLPPEDVVQTTTRRYYTPTVPTTYSYTTERTSPTYLPPISSTTERYTESYVEYSTPQTGTYPRQEYSNNDYILSRVTTETPFPSPIYVPAAPINPELLPPTPTTIQEYLPSFQESSAQEESIHNDEDSSYSSESDDSVLPEGHPGYEYKIPKIDFPIKQHDYETTPTQNYKPSNSYESNTQRYEYSTTQRTTTYRTTQRTTPYRTTERTTTYRTTTPYTTTQRYTTRPTATYRTTEAPYIENTPKITLYTEEITVPPKKENQGFKNEFEMDYRFSVALSNNNISQKISTTEAPTTQETTTNNFENFPFKISGNLDTKTIREYVLLYRDTGFRENIIRDYLIKSGVENVDEILRNKDIENRYTDISETITTSTKTPRETTPKILVNSGLGIINLGSFKPTTTEVATTSTTTEAPTISTTTQEVITTTEAVPPVALQNYSPSIPSTPSAPFDSGVISTQTSVQGLQENVQQTFQSGPGIQQQNIQLQGFPQYTVELAPGQFFGGFDTKTNVETQSVSLQQQFYDPQTINFGSFDAKPQGFGFGNQDLFTQHQFLNQGNQNGQRVNFQTIGQTNTRPQGTVQSVGSLVNNGFYDIGLGNNFQEIEVIGSRPVQQFTYTGSNQGVQNLGQNIQGAISRPNTGQNLQNNQFRPAANINFGQDAQRPTPLPNVGQNVQSNQFRPATNINLSVQPNRNTQFGVVATPGPQLNGNLGQQFVTGANANIGTNLGQFGLNNGTPRPQLNGNSGQSSTGNRPNVDIRYNQGQFQFGIPNGTIQNGNIGTSLGQAQVNIGTQITTSSEGFDSLGPVLNLNLQDSNGNNAGQVLPGNIQLSGGNSAPKLNQGGAQRPTQGFGLVNGNSGPVLTGNLPNQGGRTGQTVTTNSQPSNGNRIIQANGQNNGRPSLNGNQNQGLVQSIQNLKLRPQNGQQGGLSNLGNNLNKNQNLDLGQTSQNLNLGVQNGQNINQLGGTFSFDNNQGSVEVLPALSFDLNTEDGRKNYFSTLLNEYGDLDFINNAQFNFGNPSFGSQEISFNGPNSFQVPQSSVLALPSDTGFRNNGFKRSTKTKENNRRSSDAKKSEKTSS